MKLVVLRLACRIAEAWPRLYTLGMTPSRRQWRLNLIRADVADEVEDRCSEGASPWSTSLSLLGRCLRGIPADLTWRLFDVANLSSEVELGRGPEGSTSVDSYRLCRSFYVIAATLAWLGLLVLLLAPFGYSLAVTGALLSVLALAGWLLEARATPDGAASASSWPLLLSVGIVSVAAGIVFNGEHAGLALAAPVAFGFAAAAFGARSPEQIEAGRGEERKSVSADILARRAASGDVIAIEAPPARGLSRRALLRGGFGLGLASVLAAMGGIVVDFLWQRNVAGFGGVVNAGSLEKFPPGSKTIVREGKFWLVNLTEAQGGPGFLALWQKCPHLGCVVPWLDSFRWHDPATGQEKEGWFRCPCHQSTYNDAGVRVYGPAPRSMDRMALRVTEAGYVEVDTGAITKGAEDNATHAVKT